MQVILQDDWSGGIVQSVEGQRAPQNASWDIVNGVIDGASLKRRGGTKYHTTFDAPAALTSVANVALPAVGSRTLAWSATEMLRLSGNSYITMPEGNIRLGSRPVSVGAGVAWVRGNRQVKVYAGSLRTTGTSSSVTFTKGSTVVTGSATTWLTTTDAGSVMTITAGAPTGDHVVKRVVSDTSLELMAAYEGATVSGVSVAIEPWYTPGFLPSAPGVPTVLGTAGTPPRLLMGIANRLYFTATTPAIPATLNVTEDYHELPADAFITGIQGSGGYVLVFTTRGVYQVGDFNYDLTDAFGNVQHTVRRVNLEVQLWGEGGLAEFGTQMIVPALDDVYAMTLDGNATPISQGVRDRYRSYVQAGHIPGLATVFRNRYILPILTTAGVWVDTLVCLLDGSQPAWTRWAGHAASPTYIATKGTSGAPMLLGVNGLRITNLTSLFEPVAGNARDANGTIHNLTIETRHFATRAQIDALFRFARLRYELTPAEGSAFTTVDYAPAHTDVWDASLAGGNSMGQRGEIFRVEKRAQAIKLRIRTEGAISKFVLRSLELHYRESRKP